MLYVYLMLNTPLEPFGRYEKRRPGSFRNEPPITGKMRLGINLRWEGRSIGNSLSSPGKYNCGPRVDD